eukprot:gnl/Chilomastix_caulleri/493.p1 GENE.gnl/Chilomastix_caulleri/493~~gnl/Chilomastix_caulleri/493.p1  ORF type:complete len:219 (+),score=43.53 gnl/Chilomastix_caulleri/493:41-658(+)
MGSIETYNGSALVAVMGKDSVAIASDKRFGIQYQTITWNYQKIFQINRRCFIGLGGLATDIETVVSTLRYLVNMYELREEREISPVALAKLTATFLYQHRFGPYYVEPIIAGLQPDGTPYIATMDSIGALSDSEKFACTGTAAEHLLGACEGLVRPDMSDAELTHVVDHVMQVGTGRDIMSGWAAEMYVISGDGVQHHTIDMRTD